MSLRNPEKFPVKFYSWQDNDAPQLANADGCIKTILKACLVTGYGGKDGAGWEMLFDEAYRMVLRRPLRTGNPPDIKIENGVINGVASHRIVAQDNPSSLDDSNELSAVNLLARGIYFNKEWYLVVSDFAFILCYQMGDNYGGQRNSALFVGSAKKLSEQDADYFLATTQSVFQKSGMTNNYAVSIIHGGGIFTDLRKKTSFTTKHYLNVNATELFFGGYFAQKVLIDKVAELPFFTSVPNGITDLESKKIIIDNRPMFRYFNRLFYVEMSRVLYIPLDYWEL